MATQWILAKDRAPEHNSLCHICHATAGCSVVHLNIVFKEGKDGGGWLDLFATPEAGSYYSRLGGSVVAWMPATEFQAPPDAWLDAHGEAQEASKVDG